MDPVTQSSGFEFPDRVNQFGSAFEFGWVEIEGRCICLDARPQERIFSALPESRNLNAKPQERTFETDPGCEC